MHLSVLKSSSQNLLYEREFPKCSSAMENSLVPVPKMTRPSTASEYSLVTHLALHENF